MTSDELVHVENQKQAALNSDADIVIHSFHKILSCPTQTGLFHLTEKAVRQYGFSASELRASLTLIQSSSPNYFFIIAIDKLVTALGNGKAQQELERVEKLGRKLQQSLRKRKDIKLYQPDCEAITTDILIKHNHYNPQELHELLINKGIFPEAILGKGLLFFLGIGSQQNDIDILTQAMDQICSTASTKPKETALKESGISAEIDRTMSIDVDTNNHLDTYILRQQPVAIEQALSPREAFFMPSQVMSTRQAIGQISAECRAPCPPGWPILVPGQRIGSEILQFKSVESIRVVKQT
jgi:arginine/lysine/ornithine decarboxylase